MSKKTQSTGELKHIFYNFKIYIFLLFENRVKNIFPVDKSKIKVSHYFLKLNFYNS